MLTRHLDYPLPESAVATEPAEPRDTARLMVVRRSSPDAPPEHHRVRDLPELLAAGDRLVVNDTRVVPARFVAVNAGTGGAVEGLWLRDMEPQGGGEAAGDDGPRWSCMIKARRHRAGYVLRLLDHDGEPSPVTLTIVGPAEDGAWEVRVQASGEWAWALSGPSVLARLGRTPLPPYIRSARRLRDEAAARDRSGGGRSADDRGDAHDRDRYQTVYAADGEDRARSVAAPTAGLHFTPGLLDELAAAGVGLTSVTLHVGAGTFKPVSAERVRDHTMHREWCEIIPAAADELAVTERAGGRLIAVGTTGVRTIEAFARAGLEHGELNTDLFILPGDEIQRVDGLLTNFHLPNSTLLCLVAAFLQSPDEVPADPDAEPPGVARLKRLYAIALGEGYRFFSYGDAMLILP